MGGDPVTALAANPTPGTATYLVRDAGKGLETRPTLVHKRRHIRVLCPPAAQHVRIDGTRSRVASASKPALSCTARLWYTYLEALLRPDRVERVDLGPLLRQ